jgi:hypothetical protein
MPTIEQAAPRETTRSLESKALPAATTLHVRFTETPEADTEVLMRFQEPYPRVATCRTLPPGDLGDSANAGTSLQPSEDELFILHLPSTAEPQWNTQAEKWMALHGVNGTFRALQFKVDGGVVLWKPGLAVVRASAECLDSILEALVDFAFFEGELRKLEREVAADCLHAQRDVSLVYHVTKAELARSEEVGMMTSLVLLRRLRCARLGGRLVEPPRNLSDSAFKFASRLRDETDVESRLEIVDGQIEVYEYQYEMINQRLSDYSNFRREYVVEIVIVVLLALELITMTLDFWAHHQLIK